jgi:hypothetical protein
MKLLLSLAPLLTLTAAKYSEDAAKRYVDLAGAAYCTPEQIETGESSFGITERSMGNAS